MHESAERNEYHMKKLSKIIALFLALALSVGMISACSAPADESDQPTSEAPAEATDDSEEPEMSDDPADWPTIQVFQDMIGDFDPDSEYAKKYQELAQVNVEWILPARENFIENLNIMLASTDLPDIINDMDATQWSEGVENGVFISLEEYKDDLSDVLAVTYDQAIEMATIDGELYSVPRINAIYSMSYMVRKDWMDTLGLEAPTTLEEYYTFMEAFAKGDPDGNGKDDTFAISPQQGFAFNHYGQYALLMNAFGVGFGWQDDGTGTLVDTNYVPETKEFLEYMKNLVADGIVDPAWITNKQYQEQFYNGQAAMIRSWQGSRTIADAKAKEVNPDAEIIYIDPPLGPDGEIYAKAGAPGATSYLGITSTSENPEAACRFINSSVLPEVIDLVAYGVEGVHHNVVDGEIELTDAFEDYLPVRTWLTIRRDPNNPKYFLAANLDEEDFAYESDWYENKMVPRAVYDQSLEIVTPTMLALNEDDWTARIEQTVMQIIYNELPLDAWDTLCEDYKAAGFDQVAVEVNEWYQENK